MVIIVQKKDWFLNIINYEKVAKESFEDSSFLYKNRKIELAFMNILKMLLEMIGK